MPEKNRDDLFRQIASDYVNAWGESLQQEQEELAANNTLPLTPRMDRTVLGQAAARRRRRRLGTAGALAACLLLAVLLPQMGSTGDGHPAPSSAEMAADRLEENAAFALPHDTAPDAGEGDVGTEEHLPLLPPAAPEGAAPEEAPASPAPEDSSAVFGQSQDLAIPLPFALPEHFMVLSAEQEGEKTVYHLVAPPSDDEVVLTLENTTRPPDTQGLASLSIHGETVFTSADWEPPFLTFQKDEILYEMTGSSGLEALIDLSRWIL